MSHITTGSVVDVATARGLSPVIIGVVTGDSFTGYRVDNHDHSVILDEYNGHVDEVLFPHDERALVIAVEQEYEDDEPENIVVFRDADGEITLSLSNEPNQTFRASDANSVVNGIKRLLRRRDRRNQEQDITDNARFYTAYVTGVLGL